jgi:hypothetical protein
MNKERKKLKIKLIKDKSQITNNNVPNTEPNPNSNPRQNEKL